jgi:acyl carrier protein
MSLSVANGARAHSIGTVVAELKSILSEALRVPEDQIDERMSLLGEGVGGLDSVMLVEVICEVEQRLGFEFRESDFRVRSFESVTALAHVILARLAPEAG